MMALSNVGSSNLVSRHKYCPWVNRIDEVHQRPLTVTSVIKTQPGGAQSRLVLCDDQRLYVLKMHPNPQGPNVLANEALGAIIMDGLGLLAPRWKSITINLKTLKFFPDLAMHTSNNEITFPHCGLHFGSEYLGGPQYDLYDFMPKSCSHKLRNAAQQLAVYLFDIWANHRDERQCIFQRIRGQRLYDTFFIDNGHLFGGPGWSEYPVHSRRPPSYNIDPPLMRDPRIDQWLQMFDSRIPKLLHGAIALVPKEWYEGDIYALYARLLCRLDTLRALVDLEILQSTRY